jgi:hypothetical protein
MRCLLLINAQVKFQWQKRKKAYEKATEKLNTKNRKTQKPSSPSGVAGSVSRYSIKYYLNKLASILLFLHMTIFGSV